MLTHFSTIICLHSVPFSTHPNDCKVEEECAAGTFVCDLYGILKSAGVDPLVSHEMKEGTDGQLESVPALKINIINDAQTFTISGTRLLTRGRVDREHYIRTKQCRSQVEDSLGSSTTGEADDDESFRVACVHTLELAVFDGPGRHQPIFLQLPVKIEDVNDHAPRFDQHTSGLWLEVDEDVSADLPTHPSAQFTKDVPSEKRNLREVAVLPLARDVDYGQNGTVTYSLGGIDATNFQLNWVLDGAQPHVSTSGDGSAVPQQIVRLSLLSRVELDHEKKQEHRLFLVAQDSAVLPQNRRTAQLPITVAVREVNEFSPVFDLGVTDSSSLNGQWNAMASRMHPDVVPELIRKSSAAVTSNFESNYNLNDPPELTLNVPESVTLGSRLYRIVASDADTVNSDMRDKYMTSSRGIQYGMGSSADLKVGRYFRVGADDGWITLIHQLDYESGPRNFRIPVVAVDSGRPSRTGNMNINVHVSDVNDEAPAIDVRGIGIAPGAISSTTTPEVLANGLVAPRFQTLVVSENSPEGTFIAKGLLDNLLGSVPRLNLKHGVFEEIHIPTPHSYNNQLPGRIKSDTAESANEGDDISTTDRDRGPAGEVSCFLSDPPDVSNSFSPTVASGPQSISNYFTLQPSELGSTNDGSFRSYDVSSKASSGRRDADYVLLTKAKLDREQKPWYFVTINCHDHGDMVSFRRRSNQESSGGRVLSSTRLLKILVLDENDNGPKFDHSHVNTEVQENSPRGTKILKLTAVDKDSQGPGSRTKYRLARTQEIHLNNKSGQEFGQGEECFEVDETTGWLITTGKPIDREKKDTYVIPVVASDAEFPNRTDITYVHIQVTDVNDNAPELVGNTTFWVEEESSMQISPGMVNYRLPTPVMGSRQVFVGRLEGKDPDLNENGRISFSLPKDLTERGGTHNAQVQWLLRYDGTLFVHPGSAMGLDRETQPFHLLPVVLRDHGVNDVLSSTATITVSLIDKNDNAPVFLRPGMQRHENHSGGMEHRDASGRVPVDYLFIDESSSPGTLLYTASAEDPDEGDNAKVVYSMEVYEGFWQLIQNDNMQEKTNNTKKQNIYFIIDPESGEIRLNQRIIFNDKNVPKKLVLFAKDCGRPTRRSFAFLYVKLHLLTGVNKTDQTFIQRQNEQTVLPKSLPKNFSHPTRNNSYASGIPPQVRIRTMKTEDHKSGASALMAAGVNGQQKGNERLADTLGAPVGTTAGSAPRTMISWNSEVLTGLGIGLVIVILVCLLLLIIYAFHGTKSTRRPGFRSPARQTKPEKLERNGGCWMAPRGRSTTPNATGGEPMAAAMNQLRSGTPKLLNNQSKQCTSNIMDSRIHKDYDQTVQIVVPAFKDEGHLYGETLFQDNSHERVQYGGPANLMVSPGMTRRPMINTQDDAPWYMHTLPHPPVQNTYMCAPRVAAHPGDKPDTFRVCIDTFKDNQDNAKYTRLTDSLKAEGFCSIKNKQGYYTIQPEMHCLSAKGSPSKSLEKVKTKTLPQTPSFGMKRSASNCLATKGSDFDWPSDRNRPEELDPRRLLSRIPGVSETLVRTEALVNRQYGENDETNNTSVGLRPKPAGDSSFI
ncbi:unnamed protein product [Calicophoron daubneyi]|uniref:Cadherin domain-containing protein n=1 Tax=Calicophoron daubneyi TaxID=300641 RepID=A0AAV2T1K2_CALDB